MSNPNTPKKAPRKCSLSPWRKREPPPSKTAPVLPKIFLDDQAKPNPEADAPAARRTKDTSRENDMNGYHNWSYDEAQKSSTTTPPSQKPNTMAVYTSPRNVSGPLAVDTTTMNSDTPAGAAWNRSNPHAVSQNNSKTSQYIDKITSENERLRRELKAERLAREEEAKRVAAARSKAEDMRAEHQHLQVVADANARAIERKDRKVEELKAALETESKRRKAAESRADEALRMLGDTRSETQRQLASAYEMKHLAETNADAAREGYKRITDGYDKKLKSITESMNQLRKQRREDADKIKRQAIITDQLQHELTRNKRTEDRMVDVMGKYKAEHRKEFELLTDEAARLRSALPQREREAARLVSEMEQTNDKMKWVMAQKKLQSGTTVPPSSSK